MGSVHGRDLPIHRSPNDEDARGREQMRLDLDQGFGCTVGFLRSKELRARQPEPKTPPSCSL